jgi:hypothetical protein
MIFLQKLRELNLEWNKITRQGHSHLIYALESNEVNTILFIFD